MPGRYLWYAIVILITIAGGFFTAHSRVGGERVEGAPPPPSLPAPPTTARVGGPAPDFTLPTPTGTTISLGGFRGNVVLLNFWASWCGPCQAEMPDLRDVYEQNKEKGLVILAINVQESARQAQGFAELYRLTFPIALDETGAVSTAYRVSGLPTTYLIDRQGIIRDRVIGQMSKAMMVALFERTR